MSGISLEYVREWVRVIYVPDSESVTFVAKMQKARTRKNKDYFVLRATVPKNVAEKINAKPGDYLFFRAKKAQWYHMLDWERMEETWKMLPNDVRNRVALDGLCSQATPARANEDIAFGATNPTSPIGQIASMHVRQDGDINGSSV